MQRTKISELLRTEPTGTEVLVKGWVKAFRNNQFIALNDGSTANNIQIVVSENTDPELIKRIKFGAAIAAQGTLLESQGKGQRVEIAASEIIIYGDVNLEEYPLQPKKQSLEFLREHAHLRFRTNTFAAVFRVRHALAFAIHKFFNDRGFYYIHTPIITASDAEGAGEMFRVTTLDLDYIPFKNEKFDKICDTYFDDLMMQVKELSLTELVNKINSKIKGFSPEYSFEDLIKGDISLLFDLKGKDDAIKEVGLLVSQIYEKLKKTDLFKEIPTKVGRSIGLSDKVVLSINPSLTKSIRVRRIITTEESKAFLLSFYNFTFVDKELRALPKTARKVKFERDFFGKSTNLTVSGQLEGELAATALGDIYTFGPTFRAENSNTTRHLAEFWMIEPEVAFADLNDNMNLAEDMLRYVITYALEHCADDLKILEERLLEEEKSKPQDQRSEMSLTGKLRFVTENNFERLTYTEAIDILKNSNPNKKGKFQYPIEGWGVDLQSEHERYLVEKHFKKPVILTNYPAAIKAFYMRLDEGTEPGKETVSAMDILFPGIGEIVGGSQREERYDVLLSKMQAMHIPEEELSWYLDTRRFGTCPHAGFGLGFERLILFVTGMTNIRDVIAFPRYPGSAEF